MERVANFFLGVGGRGIELLFLDGLTQACGIEAARRGDEPVTALLGPALRDDEVLLLARGAIPPGENRVKDYLVDVGLRGLLLGDFQFCVEQALGFQAGPKGEFGGQGDGFVVGIGELGLG